MAKDTVTFCVTVTDMGERAVQLEVIGNRAIVNCEGLEIRLDARTVLAVPLPYFSRLDCSGG